MAIRLTDNAGGAGAHMSKHKFALDFLGQAGKVDIVPGGSNGCKDAGGIIIGLGVRIVLVPPNAKTVACGMVEVYVGVGGQKRGKGKGSANGKGSVTEYTVYGSSSIKSQARVVGLVNDRMGWLCE